MRKFKSVLALVLALTMILGCLGTAFAAQKTPTTEIAGKQTTEPASDKSGKAEAMAGFKSQEFKELNAYQYADDEIVRAIVILEGACEAEVAEAGSEKAAAQRVKLVNEHNAVRNAMSGINYELKYDFTRLLNGFSCDVAYGDLEAIAAIEGVKTVYIANSYAEPVLETVSDTKQVVANEVVGNNYMHYNFWDGYGTVVAVLDTGLTIDHEVFSDPAEYAADYGVLTEEMVEAAELWVDGVYISAKVPFAYDYADMDADVTDNNGHGTHVSGSAVGMAGELAEDGESFNATFMGAAPAAQLLSMKIFSDAGGGTTSDIYYYALEDAYTLGADVINMSIGAQNGFTYDASLETEVFGDIYNRLSDAGVILSVAAGNEYSMAYYSSIYAGYSGYVGPEYTDYGTVASPSTYEGNVSVASLENPYYPDMALNVGGYDIPYVDSCEDGEHGWADTFGGTEQDYVLVVDAEGNFSYGYTEDYANVDVSGKIAVVSRGDITFEEKIEFAANAGAIGCIVVNNDVGIISMAIETFEIPAISLQQSALDVLGENSSLYTNDGLTYVENASGYLMSDFSNWGTSPMLTLDPTITAIGGMVYSSVPGATDAYEVYSGTSMAAPNMSGTYANLLSAIYENTTDLTKAEAAELAKDLIYSTAILIEDADGYLYSPRKQGAGLACSYNGIWNYLESAYIANPIQELGDDPEKTGVYEMTLTVKNDGDYELYYTDFEAYVLYDYLYTDSYGDTLNTLTSDYAYEGTTSYGADVTYTYADGTECSEFYLNPGEEIEIVVTITLSDDLMAYFDENYPNGAFVEGYVVLNETYEGEHYTSNHATFLAYYGDWTDASVLEETDFMDIIEAEYFLNTTAADEEGNTYADYGLNYANSGLLNFYTEPKTAYLVDDSLSTAYAYAGDNMLDYMPYYEEHIAFSTYESDGTYLYSNMIYMEPYQLRNAEHLIMTVSDKETGEVYYVDDTQYLPKAIFDELNGSWTSTGVFYWDGTDAEGNYVPSGTVATISYDAVLPYNEALQEDIWSFDVMVDYTAPVLEEIVYDAEAGTLTVTASDENYLQAIYLADNYYNIIDYAAYSSDVKGESFTATFDVSDIDAAYVTALDYATNEMEEWTAFFETGLDATLTFVTPYGEKVVTCQTGDYYTFEKAQEPEDYEFMFWAPEKVEQATEDEVWYVSEPWWFEGDSMIVTETEYTFYALYAVLSYNELDKTNYYLDSDSDYSGEWAICGWNLDEEGYFSSYDPMALNSSGESIHVNTIEDAEVGTYYVEFYTNDPSVRYTIEKVDEDVYTIKSNDTGKYLATDDEFNIKFVDTVDDYAKWYLYEALDYYNTFVWNYGNTDAALCYDDVNMTFEIFDDSITLPGMDAYPNEWFYTFFYRCTDVEEVVLYYTTECDDISLECYFDDFSDCKDKWYHEAVDYAVANGLMNGVGEGKFDPSGSMTRAMIVTVLYRAAGSPEVTEPSTFTDVLEGQWYSDAIAWAQDNGIVNGISETEFAPMANVTREQIAAILWRYVGSPEAEADLSSFQDTDKISDYAVDAITWAVSERILNGDNGNLKPVANATRAEFACIIMRFLGGSYECA